MPYKLHPAYLQGLDKDLDDLPKQRKGCADAGWIPMTHGMHHVPLHRRYWGSDSEEEY